MKRRTRLSTAVFWIASIVVSVSDVRGDPVVPPAQGTLQAAFAPWDDIEAILTDVINGARRQVLVQAYLLTSKKIAETLVALHRRGIDVQVLLDAAQLAKTDSQAVPKLAAAGIPVWLETKYQNAHNKIIVVDADTPHATIVTGSFNFTWTAQHKNAENSRGP
jgi:phosphatidylserine/phosphatidylglycerophosphate/cardiolipin synthase-like enzyme